ncbi:hypothetical protein V8C42DRAFT_55721 [Trichoderma barbatum]
MSGFAKSSHKQAGGHNKHPDRSRASASASNHHFNYHPRSFLFVINELTVRDDDSWHIGDEWYNLLPPTEPNHFTGENPGIVMRYQNGQVVEAPGYEWSRGAFNGNEWPPGHVLMYNSDGSPMLADVETQQCAAMYKQLAVFSCNPHLPIAVLNGDPLSASSLPRTPLLFFHPPSQQGRSQAVHPDSPMERGPGPCKYVAGASPSWMPGLVPTTFQNPYNLDPSDGLAGELPIVLGLMAFTESTTVHREAVTRTFLGYDGHLGKWRDGQWYRTEAPQGYALSALENPRGFLVTVFYDPQNPVYSNERSLWELEWHDVIVRERR